MKIDNVHTFCPVTQYRLPLLVIRLCHGTEVVTYTRINLKSVNMELTHTATTKTSNVFYSSG